MAIFGKNGHHPPFQFWSKLAILGCFIPIPKYTTAYLRSKEQTQPYGKCYASEIDKKNFFNRDWKNGGDSFQSYKVSARPQNAC